MYNKKRDKSLLRNFMKIRKKEKEKKLKTVTNIKIRDFFNSRLD
jgi:hypothetical protein